MACCGRSTPRLGSSYRCSPLLGIWTSVQRNQACLSCTTAGATARKLTLPELERLGKGPSAKHVSKRASPGSGPAKTGQLATVGEAYRPAREDSLEGQHHGAAHRTS